MTAVDACEPCLRRTHLVGLLSGRIERGGRGRVALGGLLGLADDDLIAGLGARHDPQLHSERHRFDAGSAAAGIVRAGLVAVCRHARDYPPCLLDLDDAPAVLHVAGDAEVLTALCAAGGDVPAVSLVGARRATAYGLEIATALGRGVAASGLTVVSGMALGVDSAAHVGALEAEGRTIAVLAGGAETPYPSSKRTLYRRILGAGCAISELPPGAPIMRWAFPARNRIIAALGAATVVVEATERSGSLITAEIAADLGRPVGAVPGQVTGTRSSGTNALLHDGAAVVRDARDVLDLAATPGGPLRARPVPDRRGPARAPRARVAPTAPAVALVPELRRALDAVEDGADSPGRLAVALGVDASQACIALTQLELAGLLRRERDGSYTLRIAS